jgi:hypothetical protein
MALPLWRRAFASAVPWMYAGLLAAVVFQVGLAGAGLLSDPKYLGVHRSFVHVIEGLGILTILVSFLGADRLAAWTGVGLYLLVGLQYALIRAPGLLVVAHLLNALLIFTLTLLLLRERMPWPAFAPPAA